MTTTPLLGTQPTFVDAASDEALPREKGREKEKAGNSGFVPGRAKAREKEKVPFPTGMRANPPTSVEKARAKERKERGRRARRKEMARMALTILEKDLNLTLPESQKHFLNN